MSMQAAIFYRLSDYPNRPRISVSAETPINVQELRAFLWRLQYVSYADKEPSFRIFSENPVTRELTEIMEIDSDTSVEDVDLSSVA